VSITLNLRAHVLADTLATSAPALRIEIRRVGGARVLDFGASAAGGLHAGRGLARVCLAGLADVSLRAGEIEGVPCPHVEVFSDAPVLACMASQYAGWQIAVGKFFAMGSGPMRAAYGKEELFDHIPGRERAPVAVGCLEARKLPDEAVVGYLAQALQIPAEEITLLVAPAASMAGTIQVVARSLETALHKLHELKFDLGQIVSGFGSAPLPPVARDEIGAIGRTNDAILYGGRVTLWVRAEDDQLAAIGPKVPASASPDYGTTFASIFERYNRDFYKIDPMLFSPAQVILQNLKTGRSFVFGKTRTDVLNQSFFGE
jgi:methenyltetrahydromethanopterin cyclohydrolase